MLIYLNHKGIALSKEHVEIVGTKTTIPAQTLAWFEILCKNILQTHRKDFEEHEKYIEELEDKFKAIGAYEKRVLSFSDNKTLQKYFLNSIGKLNSISDILKLEYNSLKENLRMVVLTDFIRKEYQVIDRFTFQPITSYTTFSDYLSDMTAPLQKKALENI